MGISDMARWSKNISSRFSRSILRSPARIPILGFVILISIGTILLMLPEASTGRGIGFVNALFTATSASCVTGLVVVDTGSAFSPFGQVVLLILIQIGGLGIMTMSTLLLMIAGKRASLTGHIVIQDTLTHGGERSIYALLRDVALFTFVIEGIGIVLMFIHFVQDRGAVQALYLSLFHSVSAFCNAGFSLFSDSFMGYRGDWSLNLVMCFLIISGGIGFLVLSELRQRFPYNRRAWSRLSLHSKLVLSTTAILLISGTLIIILMEWRNTLAHLPLPDRFLAAFFQAVTARTAGFNTLPIGNMANETLFLFILLMFIGASPGSCGGGIKTSTIAALGILGMSRLRGRKRPQLFRRTISQGTVGKAVSVVIISMLVVIVATMALLMTELGETSHALSRGKFLELLFETVSAFGTVGLSTGITGGLSMAGKLILTVVMFVGRLGPLVIVIAVSRQTDSRYYYAEESIMIG
jgi:trk system potassium uptake protein